MCFFNDHIQEQLEKHKDFSFNNYIFIAHLGQLSYCTWILMSDSLFQ